MSDMWDEIHNANAANMPEVEGEARTAAAANEPEVEARAAAPAKDPEVASAAQPGAVARLGEGYRATGARPRRPPRDPEQSAAAAAAAAAGGKDDDDDSLAAAVRRAGYTYRRPVPLRDDDDFVEGAHKRKESALLELEMGLAAAAHGPPHQGGAPGEDEDDDRSKLRRSSSLDTAEALAFAMEWDAEAGDNGKEDKANDKRSPSPDPESFQDARDSSRSLLSMAAFFASMGKNMMEEHKRAMTEADLYMGEVIKATKKLPISTSAVFLKKFSCPGRRVARPCRARAPTGQ